jgi:hypothetical protein
VASTFLPLMVDYFHIGSQNRRELFLLSLMSLCLGSAAFTRYLGQLPLPVDIYDDDQVCRLNWARC